MEETSMELGQLVDEAKLADIPVLVYGNKSDLMNAMEQCEIEESVAPVLKGRNSLSSSARRRRARGSRTAWRVAPASTRASRVVGGALFNVPSSWWVSSLTRDARRWRARRRTSAVGRLGGGARTTAFLKTRAYGGGQGGACQSKGPRHQATGALTSPSSTAGVGVCKTNKRGHARSLSVCS